MWRRALNRPYYVFRPRQLLRRVALLAGSAPNEVVLPWGQPIRFDPREPIGDALQRTGVYDLVVCEALYRLADPRELAVDAGANIGVMTSVLATRVGTGGEVVALEPHPETWQRLEENVARWRRSASITTIRVAVSDASGTATLRMPSAEAGKATIEPVGGAVDTVECVALDDVIAGRRVGVLKLDVEGHEEAALRGAQDALARRLVRDIVFEEHEPTPTNVTRLLEDAGYTLFKLQGGFARVALSPADGARHDVWEPPSYLATSEPARARERIGSWGWRSLRR
jgi:FkbM family methyltransferase